MFALASRASRSLPVKFARSAKACFSFGELQIEEDVVDLAVMLHLQSYNKTPPCKSIKIHNNNRGYVLSIAEVKAFCQDGQNRASTKNGAVVSRTSTRGQGHPAQWRQHLHIDIELTPPPGLLIM